jgi:hypothetical protein
MLENDQYSFDTIIAHWQCTRLHDKIHVVSNFFLFLLNCISFKIEFNKFKNDEQIFLYENSIWIKLVEQLKRNSFIIA